MKNGEYKVIALGLYKTEALARPKRDHVVSSREKCEKKKKVLGRNLSWENQEDEALGRTYDRDERLKTKSKKNQWYW